MKRMLFMALAMTLALTGCATSQTTDEQAVNASLDAQATQTSEQTEAASGKVLDISENMFLTQINDIYLNIEQYEDTTIKVEGMYGVLVSNETSEEFGVVYRNGPGCCGNDGWGGFFLNYDGELPQEDEWIEVIGTPELVHNGVYADLYLNVTSLQVKQERGAEFVEK